MTWRGLIVAFGLLTYIPVPNSGKVTERDLALAANWAPAVGLVIGSVLGVAYWVTSVSGAWIAALVVVLVWIGITGALHLDGLGDVADAFGAAHRNPDRLLPVLSDPHAGNFAVIAITVQIMTKLVLLSQMPAATPLLALAVIPAWARWGTLVWSAWLDPLKPGMGSAFGAGISKLSIVLWAVALTGASIATHPPLLAALLFIPLIAVFWRWRLGGIAGDCIGASVEVTETLLLAVLVLGMAL
jgi:adenosylcobinamide-GDP ribazoletransferase